MDKAELQERANQLRAAREQRTEQLRQALRGVDLDERDEKLLHWLAGWEPETVERIASLIERARQADR